MRQYLPHEFRDWTLTDSLQTYNRETIYDFIDGAGEVYLAYGLRSTTVFLYERPDGPAIQVEFYDMGSAEDAYGVFSVARTVERQGIGNAYVQHGGFVGFWQDRYFVCLMAQGDLDGIAENVAALAQKISSRLPAGGEIPRVVGYLPPEGMDPNSIRYMHLHPSLNYYYYLSETNLLHLSDETNAVLAAYGPEPTLLVLIEYPDSTKARTAHASFAEGYAPGLLDGATEQMESGKWLAGARLGRYLAIALDAATEEEGRTLALRALALSARNLQPQGENNGL